MITLDQLLASRDARVEHQMELAEKFPRASLICLTVMLPGPVKRDWRSLAIAHAGIDALHAVFGGHGSGMDTPCSASTCHSERAQRVEESHLLFSEERDLETGFEAYFVVDV
ncbi:MAG: citrate lyase holo-[acyl-carrier protein] synthase, partial [Bacteroidales bacterium]|nr:citrate lyase holo-[acyl-carrier protein] synthase [Bacteroidales bacterium]